MRQESTEFGPFGPTFDLLPDHEPVDALAVTYQESARFLHEWHSQRTRQPRNVGVVSVGEQMRSASTTSPPQHTMVRGVADATDIEEIRDCVDWYLNAWPTEGRTAVYFDTVTDLVENHGVDETASFLRAFKRVLDAHDAVGYFCLRSGAHDQSVVREIASLFDTVIESVDEAAETSPEPSVTDCFSVLRDARRRQILAELAEQEDASVEELTDRVTARTETDYERTQVSLVSVHLPKLADHGVVAYDRDRGHVAQGEHFDRVEPYLRKALEHQ